jgi:hypothetical protein
MVSRTDFESGMERQIQMLFNEVRTLERRHEELRTELLRYSDQLFTAQWQAKIGVDPERVKARQIIPVRVYVSDDDTSESTRALASRAGLLFGGIADMLYELDFETFLVHPDEDGSLISRAFAWTSKLVRSKEAKDVGGLIMDSAKARFHSLPEAEAADKLADAVQKTMAGMKEYDHVLAQVGPVRIAATRLPDGSKAAVIRTMTPEALQKFEEEQADFKPAKELIDAEFGLTYADPALLTGPKIEVDLDAIEAPPKKDPFSEDESF